MFRSYRFDPSTKILNLEYGYDDSLTFTETYTFGFDFVDYDQLAFDRACQLLFFMAGVSYYKAYVAPEIRIESGQLDEQTASFFRKTYQRGLGEFFYINQLDPQTAVPFRATTDSILNMLSIEGAGQLVGLGGGKDSLVSVELLRTQANLATWSLGHKSQLSPLVDRVGLPHYWVERAWDPQLLELNKQGALNGHVPISAIFACVGSIVAILSGKRDVVVSNEQSANEPTLEYNGASINHQYSKSQEFESDFQTLLQHHFGDTLRYYSLLRPFSELRISELFAQIGFDKYKDVFSSCNRAFVHTSDHMSWCGECPKCAFVFLALTPFIERSELEKLWGKNLLLDPTLESTYRQLLGIEGDKPLDCVGEVKESRSAMQLAFATYPELESRFTFEIPNGYNWRAPGPDEIPAEIYDILQTSLQNQQ